jgi:hypothetical protein
MPILYKMFHGRLLSSCKQVVNFSDIVLKMAAEPERKRLKVDEDEGGGGGGFHDRVPDEIWLSIIRQRFYLFTHHRYIYQKG